MLKPKQHNFADDELRIYDDAIVYKRGDYFQMRMWLHNEKRYARFSLRTVNVATAVDRACAWPCKSHVSLDVWYFVAHSESDADVSHLTIQLID